MNIKRKKIIIDANVANEFPNISREASRILSWIRIRGNLSIGGKNLKELSKTRFFPLILELVRAGRATRYPDKDIQKTEDNLNRLTLKSDDPHVIALAILSASRLLFTRDEGLMHDFTDPRIIFDPRGKCYKNVTDHEHLLR